MDGYAVRAVDTLGASADQPIVLRVVGEVAAGYMFDGEVTTGTAVRIMTGAPLPAGATVVKTKKDLPADRVVMFASSKSELDRLLPDAIAATKPDGALWVAYPIKQAGRSDLSREIVHNEMRLAGWKPVAQIAIDDVWSAIRARPATESERCLGCPSEQAGARARSPEPKPEAIRRRRERRRGLRRRRARGRTARAPRRR